jgi:hypothetical protein
MPTNEERPPAANRGATPKHRANGYRHSNADHRHQAPTPDERRETKLVEELRGLGYCIAVSCVVCGHALTSPRSVALMVGPTGRAKVAAG